MFHELKTLPEYFEEIWIKNKSFEIRKNDRNFSVGDQLILREYSEEDERYTGRAIQAYVPYIINGPCYGLKEGYCVMSIAFLTFLSDRP